MHMTFAFNEWKPEPTQIKLALAHWQVCCAFSHKLDATLTAWRERRLTDTVVPALLVDAHVEQVHREGQVRATAALRVVSPTPGPGSLVTVLVKPEAEPFRTTDFFGAVAQIL